MTTTTARPVAVRRRRSGAWVTPALLALALIPVVAGTLRVVQLTGGPDVIPADPRWAEGPVPVVVHVVGSIGYALLGAFQFSAGIRRRHPRWHRTAGRALVVLGLVVALSALWLTLLYPFKEGTGWLLWGFRLLAGTGMAASLLLGLAAVRRRDVATHRAWMRRAYALALGAGTQALTVGLGEALLGSGVVRTDLMLGAGWAINLAVAEWLNARAVDERARSRAPRIDGGLRSLCRDGGRLADGGRRPGRVTDRVAAAPAERRREARRLRTRTAGPGTAHAPGRPLRGRSRDQAP